MRPLLFAWDSEADAMIPHRRFLDEARRTFAHGEHYRLAPIEERSLASHNQYFAAIHDKWLSLPDDIAVDFPTPEALRAHALCMTGFRRERKFVASSREEARKLAAWLRPRDEDSYAIISVHENVVVEWRPLSQSYRAMPRKQFQESKQAVLDWIDDLLGVERAAA